MVCHCIVPLEILSHYVKGSTIWPWVVRKSAENCLASNRESDTLNTSRPTGHKPCKYARYVAKSWNVLALSEEKIEAGGQRQGERNRNRPNVRVRERGRGRGEREGGREKGRRTKIEMSAKKRTSLRGATKLNGGKKSAENKTRRDVTP